MTYRCPNNLNLSLLFLWSAWPMRRAPLACGDQGLEIHSTRTVPGLTVMLTASPPHPSTCSAKPWVTSTPSSATAVGKGSCWFSRPATWHLTVQQQENRHSNSLTPTGICQKSMFLGVEDPANTHNADSEEAYVFPWGVRTSIWDLAACLDHPGFTMLLPNHHFSAERITTLVLRKNEERREVETGMTVYYWTRGCRLCLCEDRGGLQPSLPLRAGPHWSRFLGFLSSWVFQAPRDGASTAALGNHFQCLTVH